MKDIVKWLLVEWSDGSRGVVSVRSLVAGSDVKLGDTLAVRRQGGVTREGKLIAVSGDRSKLQQQLALKPEPYAEPMADPEPSSSEEAEDYSPSVSSWEPEMQSSSDTEEEQIKLESMDFQYPNKRKIIKSQVPSFRASAVTPSSHKTYMAREKLKQSQLIQTSGHVQQKYVNPKIEQLIVNSPEVISNNPTNKIDVAKSVSISLGDLEKAKTDMKLLKDLIVEMKNAVASLRSKLSTNHLHESIHPSDPIHSVANDSYPNLSQELTEAVHYTTEDDIRNNTTQYVESQGERRNTMEYNIKPIAYGVIKHNSTRSRFTNNCNSPEKGIPRIVKGFGKASKNAAGKKRKQKKNSTSSSSSVTAENTDCKMVPIGSGKTFVPNYVYRNINWDSYTIATRKLLMAIFSRRVLATHSLTGKASPAFANKPAKLCLDQKKVNDIVMTVTKKSKVKETLVRSAITTKCADEYKMLRMKSLKKQRKLASASNASFVGSYHEDTMLTDENDRFQTI